MYFFQNDYNSVCYKEILDDLYEALEEKNIAYGFDKHSENARNLIKKSLGDENVDIYFLHGGTAANIVVLSAGMRQQDSIISATSGHIQGHEAGSIEATGLKIDLIDSYNGKINIEDLNKIYKKYDREYMTSPKKLYISNTTELGTVYKKNELINLYNFCREKGLYFFIDGARMAHALVSEECDYGMSELTKMCDIFYLGGTKAGFLFGEALIVKNEDLKKDMIKLVKQKGALLAKGFIQGIMWESVFKREGFYLKGPRHAYNMAKILAEGLIDKGYMLEYPFQSNQIFVRISKDDYKNFKKHAYFELTGSGVDYVIARLVTNYKTSEDEVYGFLEEV